EDSRKADGLILLGYGDFDDYSRRLDQLVTQGTHFVRWGSADPAHPGTVIGCDNVMGGRDAGAHLIARGRRRIAFLGDASSDYPESRDRYRGLAGTLRDAGLAVDPGLQVDALSSEASGYDAARRLSARGIAFDAIFAASDMIALGAVRALAESGRSVPDDVALVGFDDIPAASLAQPPLTTVRQDYAQAGELLVDMLIRRINRKDTAPALLAPELVVRKST
ncbi:LacI family transcriptional regulator, partial [Nostoc sp. 3335mG]